MGFRRTCRTLNHNTYFLNYNLISLLNDYYEKIDKHEYNALYKDSEEKGPSPD